MSNEYLNEQKYQQSNKKVKMVALIILLVGILIGGSLIITGAVKMSTVGEAETEDVRTEEDIQTEIDALNDELVPLKAKQNTEFRENGFSEEYYRIENEIKKKNTKISDLNDELWKMESGYNDTRNNVDKAKYVPFIIFGAFIIISSGMISGFVFIISKRREILAYTTQQVLPVAQEGAGKMAHTAGAFAREIAKGAKEGWEGTGNNNQQ